ncbi:ROK family protein [Amnibacterium sp. CER49]|uniref:ROK family protein n=1 Tax=Amnibacterium sp. CER49 TaxID=3039161 RepID=UPI002448990F|nr:ROK family protein [Amnibacterium sp. CER49]MDH2444077.1 ROK family protein [Amnibacterium sp. CER49]
MTAGTRVLIAVDIGGTTIKAGLYPEDGPALALLGAPTFLEGTPSDPPGDRAVAAVLAVVGELAELAARDGHVLVGIGVCSPGVVDSGSGVVVLAVNLGWADVPIAALLRDRFGVPVALDHDARAASLAERRARSLRGRDADDFVFIPIGTGVSATVVSGGAVLTGAGGAAGEFGHVPVVPGGERCSCGQRGCVEVYASASNILRRYREAGGAHAADTPGVVERIETDEIAALVWHQAVSALATGIVMLTAVLDPTAVVLGGGLSEAGDRLLAPVRRSVADLLTWRPPPAVERSLVGPAAALAGAALLAGTAARSPLEQET